ncbi:MAG: hypothetical protein KAS75_04410 [Planctomycetes bacterium]|nr:hypothetical protein [Planctomycetota bacterium]
MVEEKKDSVEQQKKVEYYAALVNAWIQTKMDHDKVLITLSAGGIALLVSLLSTVGVKQYWELGLYILAALCFLVTIVACIFILERNSKHIENVLAKKATEDYLLSRLDGVSRLFFIHGMIFSLLIGVVTAVKQLNEC